MADTTKAKKVDLPDIMLAMDVVDTLRHQQSIVTRELDTEAYDRALIDKVRKIYADQGLKVSDEIINRGVAALRENRFTYTPPKWRPKIALARMYANRGKWSKVGAIVAALVLAVWLVFQFAVVGPASRERTRQGKQLTNVWKQFQSVKKSSRLAQVGDGLYQQAKADLEGGRTEAASSAIAQLTSLSKLPDQIVAVYTGIKNEAQEKKAVTTADRLYRDALAALDRGDVATAKKTTSTLQMLANRLASQYTLRIVSQPNKPSGVWRNPPNNPNTRNYYIIVEAVTPDGKRIALPVINEEDGKAQTVTTWGVRVPDRVFNQIRSDKQDNGIIDENHFGVKRRGYLAPEYLFPTAGGMITKW